MSRPVVELKSRLGNPLETNIAHCLPAKLDHTKLGVEAATCWDSWCAGLWVLKNLASSRPWRWPFRMLGAALLVALGFSLCHGGFPVNEAIVLGICFLLIWTTSSMIYESARRHPNKDMYRSTDKNAVMTIERKQIDGIPVYQPRLHTVRKMGRGLGAPMRTSVIGELKAVCARTDAGVYVVAQNKLVQSLYQQQFDALELDVATTTETKKTLGFTTGSKIIMRYPKGRWIEPRAAKGIES